MGKLGSHVPAFFLPQDKIRIRKKGYAKLKLIYIPVIFEIHRCHIILTDDTIGEIQYEVVGIPQFPTSIDTIRISTYIDSSSPIELPVS